MSNWGKGVINNIGWGQGSTNNSNGWGSAYKTSNSGQTLLEFVFKPIQATGGDDVFDITQDGIDYRVHVFEGSDDFVVSDVGDQGKVECVLVGGGGAGLSGGGGGGYFEKYVKNEAGNTLPNLISISTGQHAVVVGAGGSKISGSSFNQSAGNGGNSSFYSIVAEGGKGAFNASGNDIREGGDGGSGGGASASINQLAGDGGSNGADGGQGQRGDGGQGQNTPTSSNIIGEFTFYSGGGGAGIFDGNIGIGGIGGGGDGAIGRINEFADNGQPNTGGGGGGGGNITASEESGNGGSGIVIIRYPLNKAI